MIFPVAYNLLPDMQSGRDPIIPDRITYRGVMVIFSLWFCGGLLIFLPNNGGVGLELPFNILSWCAAALVTLWLALRLPSGTLRPVTAVPALSLLPLGAFIWSLPLLWSPSPAAFYESLPHVIALWGLLALLWVLRRQPLSCQQKRGMILLLAAAGLLQALYGFAQLTLLNETASVDGLHPYIYHRPLGIFQQPNVLGSFVATGVICLLASRATGIIASFSLLFMAFMIVLIQSRTAFLGEGAGAVLLAIAFWRQSHTLKAVWRPFVLMFVGTMMGIALLHGWLTPALKMLLPDSALAILFDSLTIINKVGSTVERWAIIKVTLQLIMQHPFLGVGYGGFESAFIHQAVLNGGPSVSPTLTHPHNELLYAWSEGGLPGLLGLLLMAADLFISLWRRGGWGWTGLALLMPVAMHINLEYPLYLSVPHGIALALLLSVILAPASFTPAMGISAQGITRCLPAALVRWTIVGVSLSAFIFMIAALQTQQKITVIEGQGMVALQPENIDSTLSSLWNTASQAPRIDYDRHVALLLDYNKTQNIDDLIAFDSWARNYLSRHYDANIYASELAIYSRIYPEKAGGWCRQARTIWPKDPRFICNKYPANN